MSDVGLAHRKTRAQDLFGLMVSLALALGISGLGGWLTAPQIPGWYAGLAKPSFNPPNWVFAPVWTTLFVLMALAAWRVWRAPLSQPDRKPGLMLYGVQLGLNLAWSAIFFGLQQPGWAAIEAGILWLAIAATGWRFAKVDRWAGLAFLPYLAWVGYAIVLTTSIWMLNR